MTDEDYISLALEQADLAAADDEVPIGAVIVNPADGSVVAYARNKSEHGCDPCAHAELLAIRQASEALQSKRLWDLDLYVTLEPCTMCAAAISFARIRRVIFGATDPKGGAVVSGVRFFESPTCHHRPEVVLGVKSDECAEKLRTFFAKKRVKYAQS